MEVSQIQHDRQTLDEMQRAWLHNPTLRSCVDGHYAIGLLWEVFELRRARVLVRDEGVCVRWFVGERDALVRMGGRGGGVGSAATAARGSAGSGNGEETVEEEEE